MAWVLMKEDRTVSGFFLLILEPAGGASTGRLLLILLFTRVDINGLGMLPGLPYRMLHLLELLETGVRDVLLL